MAETDDPYQAFRFVVEIADIETLTGFTEVSGLGNETAVIEYRSGGQQRTRKIPGRHSHQNIVLKRGLTPTGRSGPGERTFSTASSIAAAGRSSSSTPNSNRSCDTTSSRLGLFGGRDRA